MTFIVDEMQHARRTNAEACEVGMQLELRVTRRHRVFQRDIEQRLLPADDF